MKRLTLFIILLLIIINISAQDFTEKEPELVTIFPVGDSEESLGYRKLRSGSGNGGPTAIGFDQNENLIVNDSINQRISIFDKNWQPVRIINLTKASESTKLEIDIEGNIIGYYGNTGIETFDASGKAIFFLYLGGEKISDDIRNDGLYIIDNMIVAYNRNNGEIIGFNNLTPDYKENNKKPILNTQQVIRELERSSRSVEIEKKESAIPMQRLQSFSNVPARETSGVEYVILQDGEVLSRDFDTIQQNKPIQTQVFKSTQSGVMSENDGLLSLFNKYKEHPVKFYHGKDNSGNEYWEFGKYLFVLDLNGIPFKAIKLQEGGLDRTTGFAMSEDGEIYYMHSTETGHYLYKYERDW